MSVLEQWLHRWRSGSRDAGDVAPDEPATAGPQVPPEVPAPFPARVTIDMQAELSAEFPDDFPHAAEATRRVLEAIEGTDLESLSLRSPGLRGYNWNGYLRCSIARVVRVQRALRLHGTPDARVLDLGSYFGNFALALALQGYRVDAADGYAGYGDALTPCTALMRASGIAVHESGESGEGLRPLVGQFDAVVCAGVLEHIPHTPRLLLRNVTTLLAPGGLLLLDTPNLAYLYHRLALAEGRSIFTPIETQFYTEIPFEGHHREYTTDEVRWLLEASGHRVVSLETFNYSYYALEELAGDDAAHFCAMKADPSLRELILAVSRGPEAR